MCQEILIRYSELLADCKKARLTGTRGAENIYELQILDCLPSLEFLPENGNVIDVGSGGGLPGIVWAIKRPKLNVTLLDSINKKCEAMKDIVKTLGLSNVNIVCERCEEFSKNNSKIFDLAAARAVASIKITVALLAPLVKTGGLVMTFKGKKLNDELSEADNIWTKLGLSKTKTTFYESSKCIVTWKKVK